MNDPMSINPSFAEWRKLPPVEQARAWEKIRPGTFEEIWKEALAEGQHRRKLEDAEAQHRRRMDWFEQAIQLIRVLGAFAALLGLVYTGIYFVNHHAPTQGASVFGVGGVALVGLFLGSNPNILRMGFKIGRESDPS